MSVETKSSERQKKTHFVWSQFGPLYTTFSNKTDKKSDFVCGEIEKRLARLSLPTDVADRTWGWGLFAPHGPSTCLAPPLEQKQTSRLAETHGDFTKSCTEHVAPDPTQR